MFLAAMAVFAGTLNGGETVQKTEKPISTFRPVYIKGVIGYFTRNCLPVGDAVTFNVGIYLDGSFSVPTVQQISRICSKDYDTDVEIHNLKENNIMKSSRKITGGETAIRRYQ